MVVFNLCTFPEVCRLCLQSKHPDELVSVESEHPLFKAKLGDLLEELTFKIPKDVSHFFPSEVCSMCLEVFDFFYKYKQKMNFVHRFLVALVEVKLGSDRSLVQLLNEHNDYYSILFKDLDLCNKEELLVEDMLEEYPQYKIASMPDVKREVDEVEVLSESELAATIPASEEEDMDYQVELLEEEDKPDVKGSFMVERFLEEFGELREDEDGNKVVKIKAEPVNLKPMDSEGSQPGGGEEEVQPYCESEHLEELSEGIQEEALEIETNDDDIENLSVHKEKILRRIKLSSEAAVEKQLYKCVKCKFKTAYKEAFEAHEKRHEETDELEGIRCPHASCLKVFPNQEQFQCHLKEGTHHQHVCDICGVSLKHKQSLEVHLSRHAGVTPFPCDYCSMSFHTKTELRNHLRSIHTSTGENWICPKCGSVYKSKKLLNQHLATHADKRNFKCNLCEFAFKTIYHLKRHVATVHQEVRYNCERCEMSYGRKDKLRMHMERAHNVQSYFVCDICLRSFDSATPLAEHKNHHENPKPLECRTCLLAFEDQPSFRDHLCITYREDYICCERDFKFHVHYNRHMMAEHGVKVNARVRPKAGLLLGQLRAISVGVGRRKAGQQQCRKCRRTFRTLAERKRHAAGECSGVAVALPRGKRTNDEPTPTPTPSEEMGEEEHLVDEQEEYIIGEEVEDQFAAEC